MKIVSIATSKVPSTTANSLQVMKACQALVQLGHDLTLLLPGDVQHPWDLLQDHYGLQARFAVEWLHSVPSFKRYDFSLAAVRRARSLKADIIYAWPPQAALFALVSGFPSILELHGDPEGRLGPLVFRLILQQKVPVRFLAITQALVDLLEHRYQWNFSPSSMVVAPNGVDLERYSDLPDPESARQLLGLPQGFTAAHTGHLYAGRGADLLFELAQRCPEVHFLWVGGTPDAVAYWKDKLQSSGVLNVTLTGFIANAELPFYQAAAEVLLMPYERHISGSSGGDSAAYASPMKMFEYMACGRVILSSDLPVIREVLNTQNAVLLPPEQVDAWDQALHQVQAHIHDWQPIARMAKDDVRRYTWTARALRALEGFHASQA